MSFDVLSRELNVFRPHFLEASAGTGKTFAIEHLVTRLLIEGDSPLTIQQILVVTFTRAATRELKARIRRNLFRSKEELISASPSCDYLKAVCQQGEAAIKSAIDKLDAALICYDTAQVYTLHGFCHRLLSEFAFEAHVAVGVSDPDEKEHVFLLEQIVKDHLQEAVALPDYSPAQIHSVLKKYRRDSRRMIVRLVDCVGSGKKIARSDSYAELLTAFNKVVSSLPDIDVASFKADLALLIPHYKKMTGEEIFAQIDLVCEILMAKNCTFETFDRLLNTDLFLTRMEPKNLKVRAKLPDIAVLHYPGLVEKLRQSWLPFIDEASDSSRIFLRLARDIQHKSQSVLEKKEKLSPDALLLRVQQALQMPEFVQHVRQKYRAAIIDEFQDTDPVQWDIFQKLFLNHLDAICLVGDPKQSIYAFRNADVYTYLNAAKAMGEASRKYLDTNFRSTVPLVDALNFLFSKAKKGWMDLPGCDEPLEVIPVKAGSHLSADGVLAAMQFFVCVGSQGRSKKFPTDEMLEKKAFPFIAKEILTLHRDMAVEYHEIAILIKDRYQAQAVIDYLKECGIPASSKQGALITESIAYFAIKEVLEAACSPYDLSKIKAALGGVLIAWKEEQLNCGLEDKSLLDAKARMQSLSQLLLEKGFGIFFQEFLDTCWESSESVLEQLLSRSDLSLYLDLRRLSELLIEEETMRGLKGDAFLTFLDQISLEGHRDESRLKILPHEEKGSVTVMTTHMSKGLEFDTVFALGIASRHKPSEQMTIKQNGSQLTTTFDPVDPFCKQAIAELDAEKMRQLYVALTRAKKRLYIACMLEQEQKSFEIGEASPIELFFAGIVEKAVSHEELYKIVQKLDLNCVRDLLESFSPLISYRLLNDEKDPIAACDTPFIHELLPPEKLHFSIHEEKLYSFSALAKKDLPIATVKSAQDAPLSIHTLPMGSATGLLLHLLFERIFKRGLHHPIDENAISKLIDEQIAFSPLAQWRAILLPWIVELLRKPLIDFALCDLLPSQLQQEMEFLFPVHNGKMKGFADLVFEFHGKYYLLDWKSNYLGPSDADYTSERIIQVMQQNQYDLQAQIYAEALKRFVKLFDNRPFIECFGGAIYYFIRGKAAHHFIPQLELEAFG